MLILGQPPSRHPLLYRALGVRRDQESYSRRTMRMTPLRRNLVSPY